MGQPMLSRSASARAKFSRPALRIAYGPAYITGGCSAIAVGTELMEHGATAAEAIGNLILTHRDALGVEIAHPKDVTG